MISEYKMGLSGQAISVYKLLLPGKSLTAKEIGDALGITKHHIYRLTQFLLSLGLIDKIDGYPVTFKAKQVNEARKNYLNQHSSWFSGNFADMALTNTISQTVKDDKPFDITFFQNRDEQVEHITKQISNAKFSVKFIMLALPIGVTSEMMYECMQAVKRGVELKLLALEHTKENHNILMSYKHMGVEVRYGKYFGWHLFLIDNEYTYIVMFDPENKVIQTGAFLVHRGINQELQGIFERYWEEAVPVE